MSAVVLARAKLVEVNLTVDALRFDAGDTPVVFTTRAYNDAIPGPTIRVAAGDTLRIRLQNRLGPDLPPSDDDDDGGDDDGNGGNGFRLANTTNLHLHGLHVSPAAASDDPFRLVTPGSAVALYEYIIPVDHTPGTFYYHPHVHGSSALQQGGGMAGALIVDPPGPRASWDLPPALAAMEEEVLLLQHLCFHNRGKYQDSTPYLNHLNVVRWGRDALDPAPIFRPTQTPAEPPDYYLANGVWQPNITLAPGQFKRLRIIAGGTGAFLQLTIAPPPSAAVAATAACDVYVLAKDGIYVDAAYVDAAPLLSPGSRLDLAVRCPAIGVYTLASAPLASGHSDLASSSAVFVGPLVRLIVAGAPVTMEPPSELPMRPSYLPDLRNISLHPVPPAQRLSLDFETLGGPFKPGPPFPVEHINGASFSSKDAFLAQVALGAVQEWNVGIAGDSNVGAGNHPFHTHVNAFQVVAIAGGALDEVLGVREGEYRDTVPLYRSGRYTLRFLPSRWTGRALVHCHMIPHADLGMAAVVQLVNTTHSFDV